MIGKTIANDGSDRSIAKLFKKTWMITEWSLASILTQKKVKEYIEAFLKWYNQKEC